MAFSGSSAGLDLEAPRRNVFVTQFGKREDEDTKDVRKHAITTESPHTLLQDGRTTLQSTLLLQKRKEMTQVQLLLEKKRQDFATRMDSCAEKQQEFRNKQKLIRDRVTKFEKFLKENDAKRQRANKKYHLELKLCEQKEGDLEILTKHLARLDKQKNRIILTLKHHEKFEAYLQKVVDVLPEDYFEVNDPQIKDIMMRYKTLSETNADLVTAVQEYYDQIEQEQQNLVELMKEKNNLLMLFNSRVAMTQKTLEHRRQRTVALENRIQESEKAGMHQSRELGEIKMALNNLAEKCHVDNRPCATSLAAMLSTVQGRLLDLEYIASYGI